MSKFNQTLDQSPGSDPDNRHLAKEIKDDEARIKKVEELMDWEERNNVATQRQRAEVTQFWADFKQKYGHYPHIEYDPLEKSFKLYTTN